MKYQKGVYVRKEGYVSIEALASMIVFFMVFFLTLAFFTYIQPHSSLQRELHVLATVAERQGGLTPQDVLEFETRLQDYNFILESSTPIQVTAVAYPSAQDVSDVIPVGGTLGDPYITRSSKEVIVVTATVPANSQMLKPIAEFFGVDSVSDQYLLSETVMSERY